LRFDNRVFIIRATLVAVPYGAQQSPINPNWRPMSFVTVSKQVELPNVRSEFLACATAMKGVAHAEGPVAMMS
jgi:hypothetical protein